MGGIALPALHLNPPAAPPNVMEQYGQLLQLKNAMQNAPLQHQIMQQQAQEGQLENQQRQLQMQDQQTIRAISPEFVKKDADGRVTGYDYNGLFNKAAASGVSAPTISALQKSISEGTLASANASKQQRENADAMLNQAYQHIEGLRGTQDPAMRQQLWGQAAQWAQQNIPSLGGQLPAQAPDDKALDSLEAGLGMHAQQLADAGKLADNAKAQADARKSAAEATQTEQNLTFGPVGPAADAKYRGLQQKIAAGQPVTPDDQNWIKGYEKQKLLVPTTRIALQQGNNMSSAGPNDIKDAAQMIQQGQAPPVLTEYSFRDRTKLAAELHRQGYNLAQAEQDWKATQKYLGTLNGAQQTRLRQAIQFSSDTIPQIQAAFNQWKQAGLPSGFESFNTAAMAAAEKLPGAAGSAAHNLHALIADFTSELGTVYKGGNSSTDESLKLAAQNLGANWNEQTFNDAITRITQSLRIRKNSINAGSPVGVSGDSPYPPRDTPAPQQGGDPFAQFGGKAHP